MYTIKTWNTERSQPETRTGLPYSLAWAIATRAGYSKAQVICEDTGMIEIETKENR